MIKKSIFVFALSTLFLSCNSAENDLQNDKDSSQGAENDSTTAWQTSDAEPNVFITGHVENGEHATLLLEATTDKGSVLINKVITDNDGNFKLDGAISGMGLYQLRVDPGKQELDIQNPQARREAQQNQKAVPLTLVPGDHLNLQLSFNDFNTGVEYEGTEWAEALNGYMTELKKFIEWQKTIKDPRQYQQDQLMKMVMEHKRPMDQYIVDQIKKDPDNPANILLMTNLMPMMGYDHFDPKNLEALQLMHKAFEESYPEDPMTANVGGQVAQLEQSYNDYIDYEKKKIAPEIALPNPEGEILKLSSLRGNYVLIDFWASWCRPCRAENPNNVRLYNKYKDEKFKIFNVSLDADKGNWVKAIKEDHLDWKYHVSDLKKWNTPLVKKYHFNAIPHTVLVDPDGKIIAEGLRGQSLERKLQEIFGN